MSALVLKARSRVGVARRIGDTAAERDARRDLAAAKLKDYIEATVDAAPPLTRAQADELAVILRTAASDAA